MTYTDPNKPRRPLVPGPTSVSGGGSISARAIAMREEQRQQAATAREPVNQAQGTGLQAGLGNVSKEIFSRAFGPVGNIAGAIANVMANVGTIEKGGYNAFHKYHYARMEDLLVVLTPLMGQNGLAVIQNEVAKEVLEGNRLAVTYEFSIFHKSGEFWPERPRFTGMATARDSKGNWDDKAINKCHTNARKYFLLALFQVPAGDFDEPDESPYATQRTQQPVPGPERVRTADVPGPKSASTEEKPQLKIITEDAKVRASEQASTEGIPHKLMLGQGAGADQWAGAYIRAIGKASSKEEVKQWDELNEITLQSLYERYREIYDMIGAATERRLTDLERYGVKDPMPKDPQEAMNWVAEQLGSFKEYEGAEQFWNLVVVPREETFDEVEWGMLIKEWERTEDRLMPEEGPDAPEAA